MILDLYSCLKATLPYFCNLVNPASFNFSHFSISQNPQGTIDVCSGENPVWQGRRGKTGGKGKEGVLRGRWRERGSSWCRAVRLVFRVMLGREWLTRKYLFLPCLRVNTPVSYPYRPPSVSHFSPIPISITLLHTRKVQTNLLGDGEMKELLAPTVGGEVRVNISKRG